MLMHLRIFAWISNDLDSASIVSKLNKNDAFATMASGGIVTDPTMALIGEAGPEAVIPLGKMGGMGGTYVTVNVAGSVTSERDLIDAITQGIYNNQASGIPINYSTVY
jgi:SLT domain-containing protein